MVNDFRNKCNNFLQLKLFEMTVGIIGDYYRGFKRVILGIFVFISANSYGRSVSSISSYPDTTLVITTQMQFNEIDNSISAAVKRGKKVVLLKILPGRYEYRQGHMSLSGIKKETELIITGYGATLIPESKKKNQSSVANPNLYYTDLQGYPVSFWSDTYECSSAIEVVDEKAKLCKLQLAAGCKASKGDIVRMSQWYKAENYTISNVKDNYAYFVVDNLAKVSNANEWNVNYDVIYGHILPRYRVFHVDEEGMLESDVINFANINNGLLRKLTIEGLTFCGSAYSSWSGIIRMVNIQNSDILISHCNFNNSLSLAISVENTNNVSVRDCTFAHNGSGCISIGQQSKQASVERCEFFDNGTIWNNYSCINLQGEDFSAKDNIIRDFSYGGIRIGVWYGNKKTGKVCGVVENNEIFFSPEYFENYQKYTLMDSGAIYVYTQNDDVTIRNNYIHDYVGMKDNRGIFCDDGACNFKIINNVVINIPNSFCIDSRAVPSVENDPQYTFGKVNVGNEISGNMVDGGIRFEGRKGDGENGCRKGANFILEKGNQVPEMRLASIPVQEADMYYSAQPSKRGKVVLSKSSFKSIKKQPFFPSIKQWMRKGK